MEIANRIRINNQHHYNNNNKITIYKYAIISIVVAGQSYRASEHQTPDPAGVWPIKIQTYISCTHTLDIALRTFLKQKNCASLFFI